ncbi:MAG: hypothetical protein IPN29_11330 [Saprospiraceae bacterium]|nr:hypothetical protein [Saprospiraceae bacterium]
MPYITNKHLNILSTYVSVFIIINIFLPRLSGQDLPEEKQEIIKTFEAQLEDAQKITILPNILPIASIKKKYTYNITILPLEIKYPDPVIKPLATDPDLAFEKHAFYARGGYGNKSNPLFRLMYTHTDEHQLDYHIFLSHDGFNNKEITLQKGSRSQVDGGIRFRLKEKMQINTNVNARYDENQFYFVHTNGQDIPSDPLRKQLRYAVNADLYNPVASTDATNYKIGLSYSVFSLGNPRTTEGHVKTTLTLEKNSGPWQIAIPVQLNGVLQSGIDDLYHVNFTPALKYGGKKIWIKAGSAFYYDSDKLSRLWPDITVDFKLGGSGLRIFVASQLKVTSNNLHRLTENNPWINPAFPALTNAISREVLGGIKGEVTFLGYELNLGYAKMDNLDNYTQMETIWSPALKLNNVNAVFLRGNADFAISDRVNIGGHLIKNFYNTAGDIPLYGVHSLELRANSTFHLWKNKLKLIPELFITDRSTTLLTDDFAGSMKEVVLNNRVELNVMLDWWLGKKMGLYARANNILNNKYEKWYGYPAMGIHFNGGVLLKW